MAELAARAGVHRTTVRTRILARNVPYTVVGNTWLIRVEVADRVLTPGVVGAPREAQPK